MLGCIPMPERMYMMYDHVDLDHHGLHRYLVCIADLVVLPFVMESTTEQLALALWRLAWIVYLTHEAAEDDPTVLEMWFWGLVFTLLVHGLRAVRKNVQVPLVVSERWTLWRCTW